MTEDDLDNLLDDAVHAVADAFEVRGLLLGVGDLYALNDLLRMFARERVKSPDPLAEG